MTQITEVKDVPPDRVPKEVGQLITAGYTNIQCLKQANNNWTIRVS